MKKYSFKKGYKQVPAGKQGYIRKQIITALGITQSAFYSRLRGEVEPKVSEYRIIEEIFLQNGITDIWGNSETEIK